jgi:hypothetical protein
LASVTIRTLKRFVATTASDGVQASDVATNSVLLRQFYDHLESLGIVRASKPWSTFAHDPRIEPRHFTNDQLLRVFHRHLPR